MKHYTIPFFIPDRGCTFRCIFCDQEKITGEEMPAPEDIPEKIEKYLSTMTVVNSRKEVGFFGGSFTGISLKLQERFLLEVRPFLKKGLIHGIRLSTRPDLINDSILLFLKAHGVTCIELGVQSMSDKVLKFANRGHTEKDVENASKLILDHGIELGHQMMIGLPLSEFEDELYTARRIKELDASQVRIYPVLVIRDTVLEVLWRKKEYKPLEMDEALERAAGLIKYFEENDIKVIRCGLHPSEGLISGEEYLAGPFHPSFGQKARELISTL